MNKKCKILFFCMVFVAATAFSQSTDKKSEKILLLQNFGAPAINATGIIKTQPLRRTVKQVIAPDFYVTNLGFFCKQEIKFEKATKISFRFRVGSVEDCDRLEGKNRAPFPVR